MTHSRILDSARSGQTTIGIVYNPLSGSNRKNPDGIRRLLQDIPHARFREVSDLQDMDTTLAQLCGQDVGLLAIAGGDGMVQEVIRYLLANHPTDRWPVLTIFPGGTTNMTAHDLGITGSPEHVIARFRALLAADHAPAATVRRPALRVEQPGKAVNYGMFFGAGLIARGVKYSRSRIKKIGVTGPFFSAIIALRCLAGFLFGGGKGDWKAAELAVTWDDDSHQEGAFLFAFASTLDTLIFGSRPYWGAEQAPIHVTMVRQHRDFSWWKFLRILKGKGSELGRQDVYGSRNSRSLDLTINDEYIIDGELYRTDDQVNVLHITVTDDLTFLVP